MTSEHVWGQWLKPYLRRDVNKQHFHRRVVSFDGADQNTIRIRAGGPLTSSVSVVCEPCNTRWLSGIQNRAKPYLIPLIEGRETVVGEVAQRTIATWATMATMTGEYTLNKLASIAVMPNERRALMDTLAPLPDWRISIGTYRRAKWKGHFVHASMPINFEGDIIIPNVQEPRVPLTNTQWTTIMVGQLYIHISSSNTSPDIIRDWRWSSAPRARALLVQIWPTKERIIKWPFHCMTDTDAWRFSVAHLTHIDSIHRGGRLRWPSP
jgi:hypothetical protein